MPFKFEERDNQPPVIIHPTSLPLNKKKRRGSRMSRELQDEDGGWRVAHFFALIFIKNS